MINPAPILRAAGFCFTWRRMSPGRARVSLWRIDDSTGLRHWVTCAVTHDSRDAIRARALALLTWARSIPTTPKRTVEAQAVALSLAITASRLARLDVTAPFATSARTAPRQHRRAA